MTHDKRAEIVEAMVSAWHSEVADCANPECEACNRAASAALDIALKAAAEIAKGRVVHGNFRTWDFWDSGNCHESDLPAKHGDNIAAAILALASEGTKP